MVALIFVDLPVVVRTVQPLLEEMQADVEEAAALLGAGRWRTIFTVILPPIYPALLTGFVLVVGFLVDLLHRTIDPRQREAA